MKKLFKTSVFILALISNNAFAQEAKSNKYIVEPTHTSVSWSANHFGFSNVSGKFTDVDGVVIFNEKKPELSSVQVTIKTASILSGVSKLDTHLKSADFLAVDKFPTASFVSKKIALIGKDRARIDGDLTLMGITKPVSLVTKFNKAGVNPINNKPSIGFSATAAIKRSDFGIKYALPGVSDNVDLVIQLEANQ